MANSVSCNNCGEPIEGEPPIADDPAQRPPCPKCGSTSRHINLPGATGIMTMRGSVATATLIRYEETLLTKAQEFIAAGDFSIAVVVAHTACEISAERVISQAFAAKSIEYLEDWVDDVLSSYSLSNSRVQDLYIAVTGDKIQDQSFWQGFKEAAKRRHLFVHKGKAVTKAEADASLKAARDLVAYLK